MRGELFSIVVSDCFDLVSERQKHACAGLHDRVRVLVRQFGELGVFGGSLDVRHDNAFVIGADNRVGLPVSDADFCGDNRRPLIDIDAVRNQPAPRILALAPVVFFAAVTQVKIQRAPVFLVFPDMLIDALVTDKGDAILRQTPADLIGTPLLLRQFFFDQLHQIWRYFARLVRGLLASLRGLLVRLLEAIAARAGVANKLAADRRRIDANLPRDVGLRVAALQERVNLAALFAGQMEIAFGHFSSVRCAVPRKDSLPSDRQKNRHTQHGKVWREKTSASRVLAALASSPATKALDPDPFPRHSLRHAVYAALLHFGFETAIHNTGQILRDYVGGINSIATIEAMPTGRLSELWVQQSFWNGSASLRAGQLTSDVEFFLAEAALMFLQADWPIMDADLPSFGPIYPLSTPGVRVKVDPNEHISVLAAVFNGDPAGPGEGDPQLRNKYGVNFRLKDPPFVIAEAQFRNNQGKTDTGLATTLKFGAWAHFGKFNDNRLADDGTLLADPDGSGRPLKRRTDNGVYGVFEQQLYRPQGGDARSGITLFGLASGSPQDRNLINFWFQTGLVFAGMIPSRPDDKVGAIFEYSRYSNSVRAFEQDQIAFTGIPEVIQDYEADLELNYLWVFVELSG